MHEISVKEKVRRLREQGQSIRQIARALGVTKHAVEKAVKELAADRFRAYFRTVAPEYQTPQQPAANDGRTAHPTVADAAKLASASARTGQNGSQTVPKAAHQAASWGSFPQETGLKTAENAEKALKTWYFYGASAFMGDYHYFLRELQRQMQRERRLWAHTLRINQGKQLGILVAKAQTHCREQGLAYDSLLLSETLGACEAYLQGVLSTVVVNPALLGIDSVRLTHDGELAEVIKRALSSDSFFDGRGHGGDAN